jgi:hypothetical protein
MVPLRGVIPAHLLPFTADRKAQPGTGERDYRRG